MIKIGVIGCASIAKRFMIPAIIQNENFELIAIASRTAEKAKEFAELFGCKAITGYDNLLDLDELDAVYIPLPTGLHYEYTVKAIKSGKHCIIEKSITENLEKTLNLLDLSKRHGCVIFENFMFQYHSQIETIRSLVNTEIGKVHLFRSNFGFPPFKEDNIRYSKALGGGALLDAGAYTIKATQLFLDNDNLHVTSSSLNYGTYEVDIIGNAMLKNDKDEVSQISFGFDNYYQCNIEFWGSKGKLIADRIFTAGPGFKPTVRIEKQGFRQEIQLESDHHFNKSLTAFSNVIKTNSIINNDEILFQAKLIDEVLKNAI